MAVGSAIYAGHVVHERVRPRRHRLRYGVFTLLLDVDELKMPGRNLRLLKYNCWGLFSVFDADHGDGAPVADWVRSQLDAAGSGDAGHRILMLCYPRFFGYVFNPLTVYFCHIADGDLRAIVYEVHNTFGEHHAYVLDVTDSPRPVIRQRCEKRLYVSPFIPMDCSYDFRIVAPRDAVNVVIREEDAEGLLLAAAFHGRRIELTDAALARMVLRYPLMTIKVIVGIHWEALRLWLKGAPYFPHIKPVAMTGPGILKHHEES